MSFPCQEAVITASWRQCGRPARLQDKWAEPQTVPRPPPVVSTRVGPGCHARPGCPFCQNPACARAIQSRQRHRTLSVHRHNPTVHCHSSCSTTTATSSLRSRSADAAEIDRPPVPSAENLIRRTASQSAGWRCPSRRRLGDWFFARKASMYPSPTEGLPPPRSPSLHLSLLPHLSPLPTRDLR